MRQNLQYDQAKGQIREHLSKLMLQSTGHPQVLGKLDSPLVPYLYGSYNTTIPRKEHFPQDYDLREIVANPRK